MAMILKQKSDFYSFMELLFWGKLNIFQSQMKRCFLPAIIYLLIFYLNLLNIAILLEERKNK